MPTYKLTYFNGRGRAELARFVFAQAGVEYDDDRIVGETWPELKPKTPVGTLPVLTIDGKDELGGSVVVARYLAEKFGLAGSNELENAQIACLVDCITDMFVAMAQIHFEKNAEKKAELEGNLMDKKMPLFMGTLEKWATKSGKFLFGGKVTYADFFAFLVMEPAVERSKGAVLEKVPKFAQVMQDVKELPNIKKWMETRPKTDF